MTGNRWLFVTCVAILWISTTAAEGSADQEAGSGLVSDTVPVAPQALPSPDRLEAWVDSAVETTMEADRIPGAAVVWLYGDRSVVAKAYGLADVETARPVTVEGTIFRIGSVTKALTALALAGLVDQGLVDLDAPVGRYLATLPTVGPHGAPVRVRHLLGHSGGFDQIGERRQVLDPARRLSLAAFLSQELRPVRSPGDLGVYDTYGITLAGHLIEAVSGVPYAEYMRRYVFETLGMKSSWVEVPSSIRNRLATGYGLENGQLIPQTYEWYVTLPASSVDATVEDMGRLVGALLTDGGGLLSQVMVDRVRSEPMTQYGDMEAFSWGFWVDQRAGYRAIHHGGVMRGYSSELYLVPSAGVGFFVAYNRDFETGPPARLRQAMVDLLYDRVLPSPGPSQVHSLPEAGVEIGDFAGVYGWTLGCLTCGEGEGWPLSPRTVTEDEPGVFRFQGDRYVAVDSFRLVSAEAGRQLRFIRDSAGRVRYMVQGPESYVRLDSVLLTDVLGPEWRDRPTHPLEAIVYRARGDWTMAAAAYRELGSRVPENGRVAFYEGYSALQAGQPAVARRAMRRAISLDQWEGWSQYYVAASYAVEGDQGAALAGLDEAIRLGFADPHLLASDPWWDELRDTPAYRAALERLRH